MMDLYNPIVDRNLDMGVLPIAARVHITMLAKLMDDSAAFGLQSQVHEESQFQQRCERIAEQFGSLVRGLVLRSERCFEATLTASHSLLDHVEGDIRSILLMPTGANGAKNEALVGVPSKKVPFFIPGAIADLGNIGFSLKISLCATICYILYHAIDYPGISTSAITVMVAGLTTTGAIKQRLALRLLGATIGGLILGLGTITFLFPSMDSITSLVVLVGSVAFSCGWMSGGARFSYVGLQVAFAFYLVTLQGFGASTELEPARDRLIGILVALVVMWFVFDQIWPVRTVTAMRRLLASVLRSAASLLQLIDATKEHDEFLRNTESLRDRVGKNIATLRTWSEAVEYEFGVDREQHLRASDLILRTSVTAAALIWNQVALLHDADDMDLITETGLVEMCRRLAGHVTVMADSIVQNSAVRLKLE
jgi:multidrug resistance protein MdtO